MGWQRYIARLKPREGRAAIEARDMDKGLGTMLPECYELRSRIPKGVATRETLDRSGLA